MFNGIKLTNKGAEMLAAAQNGGSIKFTRIEIGSGSLAAGVSETSVAALVEPVAHLPIAEISRNANTVSIMFQVANKYVTQEFAFREIGLLATGDDGVEYLYAYTNAGDDAETIPLPSVTIIDYLMSLGLTISSDIDNISVEIDESLSFATKEDLNDYVKADEVIGVAHGGTGATTAADALVNLGLTATATELNYMDGVTKNVQEQINQISSDMENMAAEALQVTGAASTVVTSNLTSDRALVSTSEGKIGASDVTATELGYLDGVTSNIQTQLNRKSSSGHTHSLTSTNITGTLPLTKGGTGATTAAGALTSLGAVNKDGDTMTGLLRFKTGSDYAGLTYYIGANNGKLSLGACTTDANQTPTDNITITTGGLVTFKNALPIASGGTGAKTAAAALENLGIKGIITDGGMQTNQSALASGSNVSYSLFTAPAAGVYLIGVEVLFDNSAGGFRRIQILNGSTVISETTQRPIENLSHSMQCVTALQLSANDSIKFAIYQSSGDSLAIKTREWAVKLL